MKLRRITSLIIFLDFIFLLLTSVILFLVPQGRVAYWSDWTLWGLSKTEWTNLHINLGVLFVVFSLIHIILNWNPVVNYIRSRIRTVRLGSGDFKLSVLIVLAVLLCTYFNFPPMKWVIDFSDSLKEQGSRQYGEPPYGHAELSSLRVFVKRMALDLDGSIALLKQEGIFIKNPDQTMVSIAHENGKTPQQVYEIIKPAMISEPQEGIPMQPPPGTGKRTLADFCSEYKLTVPASIQTLKLAGFDAEAEMTLKDIAESAGRHTQDVLAVLRDQ
jgi:Domain of unknown function (DUF4405)